MRISDWSSDVCSSDLNEQENGAGIDETADQPGTGNPIHLGTAARHPNRPPFAIAGWQHGFRHHWQADTGPPGDTVFKCFGRNTLMAQTCGDTLAQRSDRKSTRLNSSH